MQVNFNTTIDYKTNSLFMLIYKYLISKILYPKVYRNPLSIIPQELPCLINFIILKLYCELLILKVVKVYCTVFKIILLSFYF